ncbi:hypothetical protein SIN8267_00155 [Sinobacterium norvegicum]|uniref:Small-conductance mechanosensitive channel n=1 Tax=Sinobacterium norvegicum TaxID=1641715 RepID=A0ABM9AAB4_9GAMM|nr:mechanosensitive ion channel family protein [Sinobacterium norvegicum]CAH0990072.1 hypothetical protein SIN8267_00155 [Sinobacterium norvegicum]
MKPLFRLLRCGFITTFMLCSMPTLADSPWQGRWDSVWRDGGAEITLEDSGNGVTGYYQPYDGYIQATIDGDTLTGVWTQKNANGNFIFVLAPDQQTFSGRFDNGEWWNGKLVDRQITPRSSHTNTTSPRETLRSFLTLGNKVRSGEANLMDELLSTLQIDYDSGDSYHSYTQRARLLLRIIDQSTLRVFSASDGFDASHFTLPLKLGHSGLTFYLQIDRVGQRWQIFLPDLDILQQQLDDYLKLTDQGEINSQAYLQLRTPRDTMRTFLQQLPQWHSGGSEHVRQTLDLSDIPNNIRQWETPILAESLKQSIDRISYVIWQEIPNNPDSDQPYVYFSHPRGDIVIAPTVDADGQKRWQFTPDTLTTIRQLYDTLEPLPKVQGAVSIDDMAFYFTLRRVIHSVAPILTVNIFLLELWQIIAAIIFILMGFFTALYSGRIITQTLQRLPLTLQNSAGDNDSKFGYPSMLIICGSLWSNGFVLLGIPDYLFTLVRTVSHSLIVAGGIWLALSIVNEVQRILLSKAQTTNTVLDDILVTLVGSLTKLILFITGAIMFAEIFSIPYETMIAGLGIGGLAFAIAARDTIANFFGSAVILADRPFSPGDKISIGNHIGFIESVGLRSTKIRTEDETVVIIPNNMVSQDIISNQTRKERSLVDLHINLANSTAAQAIADASEAITTMLNEQSEVDGKWLFVGAEGFHRSGIILRVRCYLTLTIERDFFIARHQLTMKISQLIEQHGIELEQPAAQ